MRRSRLVALPVAALLLLGAVPALAGCSFQTVVKDVTGGNVDLGGNKVPSGFPSSVPLYKGAVVFGASVGSGRGTVWNVTVKVKDAAAYQDIAKQLTDAGFSGQFGAQGPDGGGTGTFANDQYGVLVVVTDAGSNGWVANYSVSRAGVESPSPTATP
ncbi:hypothetical protein [Leifsonia shinshuensis]|uniref:Lipoprotein n=1 Tax=Leifsonia shinshuensis TaxID=150026 RepID=A0A853CSF3_9MICO|nr:hypothetical protein [Leifsonia shinshuensis]NYJ23597.1 hypothetical protein [Leifsonia shinshuensis]